jgi:hypothetical protein
VHGASSCDLGCCNINGYGMSMAKDKEQEAPKGEQTLQASNSGSLTSSGKEELAPSSSFRRPSWYELTLMDGQC